MAREVEARLKLSAVDRTGAAFGKVSKRLADIERQTSRINRVTNAINRAATAMPLTGALAPAALGYAGAQAVRQFAAVERQLTRTGLTLGVTRKQMADLRDDVMATARAYGLPAAEVQESVDAYVAAGATLKDVQADIDLLGKAQLALGASGTDTVATWDAARKSLGLTTKDAEKFFGIVGAGASAGKFEASDMAQYLPGLLPIAGRQGFQGTAGAERLVGFLEVMRDFTGDSSEAVTATGDFLDKISSPEVEKAFKTIAGIDLRKRLKEAREGGEDMLKVMHDIIKTATGGDASRLGEFFGDKQARSAADVVLRMFDRVLAAQDEVRKNAPGLLDRNNAELLKDAEASLQRIANAYERITNASGGLLVESGGLDAVDAVATDMERLTAALKGGWTMWDSIGAWFSGKETPEGVVDRFAKKGGYETPEERRTRQAHQIWGDSRIVAGLMAAQPTGSPALDREGAIKALQKSAGLESDGRLTAETVEAVKAFQRGMGLKVDGIVGPQTTAKISSAWSYDHPPAGDQAAFLAELERQDRARYVASEKREDRTADAMIANQGGGRNSVGRMLAGMDNVAMRPDGSSIEEAAQALTQAGQDAGAAILQKLQGMSQFGAAFGIAAAQAFNAYARAPSPAGGGRNGVTMPDAGASRPNRGQL